jgi:hypothetical protein
VFILRSSPYRTIEFTSVAAFFYCAGKETSCGERACVCGAAAAAIVAAAAAAVTGHALPPICGAPPLTVAVRDRRAGEGPRGAHQVVRFHRGLLLPCVLSGCCSCHCRGLWVRGGQLSCADACFCVYRSACGGRGLQVAATAMPCVQKQGEMLPKLPGRWVARAASMWRSWDRLGGCRWLECV